ncbi:MAG: transporter substrate-binding domain-containing protein [Oceanospirillaceae bacterium]|nr:transporter substrate-binding domain-containing protein [Oceanospirillaceae bacterium]
MKILAILLFVLLQSNALLAEKLRIITHEYPPFSYTDENDQLVGMSIELLHAVFQDMDFEDYELRVFPWKRALKSARNNPNRLLFPLSRKPDRELDFDWVGKAGPRRISLFKLSSRAEIHNNQELSHYKQYVIASLRGAAYTKALSNQEFTRIETTAVPEQDVNLLYRGRVDMVLSDDAVFYHIIKTVSLGDVTFNTSSVERVVGFSEPSDRWFAFGKGSDKQLVAQFIISYEKLVKQGIVDQIIEKYFK